MRRQRWILWTCCLAAACLGLALQGVWASADADDGTRWNVSIHKVSHIYRPHVRTSAHEDCDFLRGRGAVRHCAPAEGADVAYSMLCSVFPLLLTAVALALACALLTAFSPRPPGNSAAALTGAALAASFGGTMLAVIAMPRSLAGLEGLPLQLGGMAYNAAWLGVGLLAIAAILSAASALRG
jgi:hypothetical protein